MNTLLLEDPFEDVFTLNANSYLTEKIEKMTKIKIHIKCIVIITIYNIDRQVGTVIRYMYYLENSQLL